MGRKYWTDLIDLVTDTMLREGTISPGDADFVFLTDSPAEAVAHIVAHAPAPEDRPVARLSKLKRHRLEAEQDGAPAATGS